MQSKLAVFLNNPGDLSKNWSNRSFVSFNIDSIFYWSNRYSTSNAGLRSCFAIDFNFHQGWMRKYNRFGTFYPFGL